MFKSCLLITIVKFQADTAAEIPDESLGNIDAADHDCAAELLWETALARLSARSLHIIYGHLHLRRKWTQNVTQQRKSLPPVEIIWMKKQPTTW